MKDIAPKGDPLYQALNSSSMQIKSKKNNYQRWYWAAKFFIFVAGAGITILSGWKIPEGGSFHPQNSVLIISAMIALVAALEGPFNLKDKGVSYDIFLFDLRRLRDRMRYDYVKSLKKYAKKKDTYFEQYQEI